LNTVHGAGPIQWSMGKPRREKYPILFAMEKGGGLMNKNQEHLREIEVSHPKLEKLIRSSLNAGALGAKLTGGGGGGIMIALCKNGADQSKIARAIAKSGGRPIITKLGANGVRREY